MTDTLPLARAAKRRTPLLALGGGLCMPGLGHLYCGDFVRGVSYLLAVALAIPGAARLALWAPASCLCFIAIGGVLLAVGLYVCSALEAFRLARTAIDAPLAGYQRPSVYALYVAVGYVFVLAPFTAHARDRALETFVVPSSSMSPTILAGDRIFADKTVGKPGGARLWRGALAIFIYPNDRTMTFIKRVVGLPGDRIEIDNEHVRVNGRDLQVSATGDDGRIVRERGDRSDYAVLWPRQASGASAAGEASHFIVPNGEIFVLGDNRGNAVDSRRFGTVPIADVQAVARQVWFSAHASDGVRWRRIGQVLN